MLIQASERIYVFPSSLRPRPRALVEPSFDPVSKVERTRKMNEEEENKEDVIRFCPADFHSKSITDEALISRFKYFFRISNCFTNLIMLTG